MKKNLLSILVAFTAINISCFWSRGDKEYVCGITWQVVYVNKIDSDLAIRVISDVDVYSKNKPWFSDTINLKSGSVFVDTITDGWATQDDGCTIMGTNQLLMHVSIYSNNALFDSIDVNPFINTAYMNGKPFCEKYENSKNEDFDFECNYAMIDTITIFENRVEVRHFGE